MVAIMLVDMLKKAKQYTLWYIYTLIGWYLVYTFDPVNTLGLHCDELFVSNHRVYMLYPQSLVSLVVNYCIGLLIVLLCIMAWKYWYSYD